MDKGKLRIKIQIITKLQSHVGSSCNIGQVLCQRATICLLVDKIVPELQKL